MGELDVVLKGKSLGDYTNTQLRMALGAVLYTNTADMWNTYLKSLGYSGSVSAMLEKYYVDYAIPLQFRNYINAGAAINNPQNLFTDGSKGFVYDNNDLTSFYLDSAGTTQATVNGLVGLQLDKSGGLALGAELVPTGDMSDISAWTVGGAGTTLAVVGGELEVTGAGGTFPSGRTPDFTTVVGEWYTVSATARRGTTASPVYIATGEYSSAQNSTTSNQLLTFVFQAVGTSTFISCLIVSGAGTGTAYFDNVTVKRLAGNHRYQTTTGSKPILRGTPVGGNIVTNGDFASGTGWTAGAGWAIGSGVATATTSSSTLTSTLAATASKYYRVTYTVTRSAGSVQVSFGGRNGVSRSAAGTYVDYLDNTLNTNALVFTGTSFSGTVDNVEVMDVSDGQVTAPYGLQYDGIDDFLTTASVDFAATDKMAVVMGVRKLSDANEAGLIELSANYALNNGTFAIFAPGGISVARDSAFVVVSKGTVNVFHGPSAASFPAPVTSVIAMINNIAGDSSLLRVNAIQVSSSASDQGTGNFGNYALYFGSRSGAVQPFNGLDYGGVCINKTLTATELANVEKWVARRTGVAL
jgi:hypothetical protein